MINYPSLSPVESLSKQTRGRSVVNLASGSPDPSMIPLREIHGAYTQVISEYGRLAFSYPGAGGLEELKAQIKAWCKAIGVPAGGSKVVVTSGAQHAITLLAVAVAANRSYAHEDPTFPETLNSFRLLGKTPVQIPIDHRGAQLEILEQAFSKGKKFSAFYTIPVCHNPAGVNMSTDRRSHLAQLSVDHGFTCVEDDPYRPICPEPGEPIFSHSPKSVAYVGSFSKAVAPGLRIGFVLTANHRLANLVERLEQLDFSTSTINQLVLSRLLRSGAVSKSLEPLRSHYHMKLKAATDELVDNGLELVFKPAGGLFLLADLGVNAVKLLPKALRRGVAYVPALEFYARGRRKASGYARLSIGPASCDEIATGIRLIKKAILDDS